MPIGNIAYLIRYRFNSRITAEHLTAGGARLTRLLEQAITAPFQLAPASEHDRVCETWVTFKVYAPPSSDARSTLTKVAEMVKRRYDQHPGLAPIRMGQLIAM